MKLPIRYYGDPVLRKRCAPVKEITDEIRKFVDDLIETMNLANGVGLAASQVGKLLKIFVIRQPEAGPNGEINFGKPLVFINPELSEPAEEQTILQEGCLSFPELHIEVIRPQGIHVKYMDLEGKTHEETIAGFKARMIMHENDHLNGVLFIDRMDPSKKKLVGPLLKKLKKKYKSSWSIR